jgi:L,D-transpeptidase catalytic domain
MVEPWTDAAAYETGANNATTDTKIAGARLSLGSVFDFFTNTSVALRSSTDDIIRDVSTWPIIALALASAGLFPSDLPQESLADRVVVEKSARTLTLLSHGRTRKTYRMSLGAQPQGPKLRQGDHKTPEGSYILDRRNQHSQFYKSIDISYPNP